MNINRFQRILKALILCLLYPTGLQSQHLPAAALERPAAEAAAGLQVRLAHRRSQDVQVSVEARLVLRQREERQLPRRHPGEHTPLHFPQWRRPHQYEVLNVILLCWKNVVCNF